MCAAWCMDIEPWAVTGSMSGAGSMCGFGVVWWFVGVLWGSCASVLGASNIHLCERGLLPTCTASTVALEHALEARGPDPMPNSELEARPDGVAPAGFDTILTAFCLLTRRSVCCQRATVPHIFTRHAATYRYALIWSLAVNT